MSSQPPTTSNTAKRTAYGTEVPLGGASIGSGATPVPVSARAHRPEARRHLPLPRRRHQQRRHHDRPRPDLHDDPAGARSRSYATGVSADRSDAERARSTRSATTPPTTSSTAPNPAQPHPDACTSSPAPPGEDIGSGEERRRQEPEAHRRSRPTPPTTTASSRSTSSATSRRRRTHHHDPQARQPPSRCPTTAPGRWSPRRTRRAPRSKR